MTWLWLGAAMAGFAVSALVALRAVDAWRERVAWRQLLARGRMGERVFQPEQIQHLPEPARRYFLFAIAPGTRLASAVELRMGGELALGARNDPGYRPMRARQLLTPPWGLIWQVRIGLISGSDGMTGSGSWSRFRLLGLVPVARAGGDPDHHRSAFGRLVAEAAFWAPAALLPGEQVRWEAVADNVARAIVCAGGFEQAVDLTLADDGRPLSVCIQRWSNENPERRYQAQSFGGHLSVFRTFEGYALPTVVEGGNHFGTDDYFPFYRARVTGVRFHYQ